MDRYEVVERLRKHSKELSSLGVESLAVFGSVARGESTSSSDVDLLVEFNAPVGLFEYMTIKSRLEEILGTRVDLGTRASLRPHLRDRVLSEAIDVS